MLDRYPAFRKISIATGLFAGAAALTGCSASSGEASPSPSSTIANDVLAKIKSPNSQKIERRFNDAGFVDTYLVGPRVGEYDSGIEFVATSYCDKKDLIDFSFNYNDGSRTFSRTPDSLNTVCDDGKLTKDDFLN